MLPETPDYFVPKLRNLQRTLRDRVIEQRSRPHASLHDVTDERDGDITYALDAHVEEELFRFCGEWSREMPFVLVAEGIPGNGWRTFPDGASPADGQFILITDPVDGTRGIMYDKRSAWSLAGIAPNLGEDTSLADIVIAVQSEIPTSKQHLADVLWAVKGEGSFAERANLLTGEREAFVPTPSRAKSVAHGFATVSKYFPAGKALLAQVEERLFSEIVGESPGGNPLVFADEYMTSGGQLYELAIGHDRFVADLRPWAFRTLGIGESSRICAHPYDLCTELIAREAGVIVTDERGQPLEARLDIRENVSWIGYANNDIRNQVEPTLMRMMSEVSL